MPNISYKVFLNFYGILNHRKIYSVVLESRKRTMRILVNFS